MIEEAVAWEVTLGGPGRKEERSGDYWELFKYFGQGLFRKFRQCLCSDITNTEQWPGKGDGSLFNEQDAVSAKLLAWIDLVSSR